MTARKTPRAREIATELLYTWTKLPCYEPIDEDMFLGLIDIVAKGIEDAVTSINSVQQLLANLPSDIEISREYGRKGIVREWIKQQGLVQAPNLQYSEVCVCCQENKKIVEGM